MRSPSLQVIATVALIGAVTLTAWAQQTAVPPDVKAFAAQYVAAFNAKDRVKLESLQLPESLACITPANKDVYDFILATQMRNPIPPKYLLTFEAVNENNLNAVASMAHFPVKPERELHIDYQYPGTDDGGQVVLWLVRQNGRWMADFPCMTDEGLKQFRENAAARQQYRAMAAAIKEPLRSELIAMLRQHKSGEASTRYEQATGSDMRTAMLVINAL
jgi:hypothetical protein